MGGIGSGVRFAGRDSVDDCYALDVRYLARERLLTPGRSASVRWSRGGKAIGSISLIAGIERVVLGYRWRHRGGDWSEVDYPVALIWSGCNFGGRRPWFVCPAAGCGKRVALLYLCTAGIFACRRCNRLVYPCQSERKDERAARQAEKIRDRLGWRSGILNGPGERPKGMHRRTFVRLVASHDALVEIWSLEMGARLDAMSQRLDGAR